MAEQEKSAQHSKFSSQNPTAEDLLKSQTVGLVNLADFRKRRAEALEVKEREASSGYGTPGTSSGAATPSERASTPQPLKKKKKLPPKGKLSFGLDAGDDDDDNASEASSTVTKQSTRKMQVANGASDGKEEPAGSAKKFKPNAGIGNAPKIITKASQARESELRDRLRKEYLVMQEAVKSTEIAIPFVFYDGTNIPGGVVRMLKGDHIWLFLDKSRKVGAELGVGGDKSKREWARVGVDDLMLVRGAIIIPHHYEFYYFIVNKSLGFQGQIFNYSADRTEATPKHTPGEQLDTKPYNPLSKGGKPAAEVLELSALEGFQDDPSITKVVDRRWYEKNKHIYPASVWEEFDPTKDFTKGIRKDASGNSFFFT